VTDVLIEAGRLTEAGQPFVLVLFCGLIPWMTFSETLSSAAASITGRAYLVKKIMFPLEILPFTHLVAALFTHGVLLVILAITYVLMLFSEPILRVLGKNGAAIAIRVMGMVLAAFSVELLVNAFGLLPEHGQ